MPSCSPAPAVHPGSPVIPGSPEDASWVFRQLQWHSDCPGSHATLEMHPLSSAATRLPLSLGRPVASPLPWFPLFISPLLCNPASLLDALLQSVSQSVDKHSLSRMDMLVGLRLRSQKLCVRIQWENVLSPLAPCSQSSHVVSQDREENRASLLPWPQLGFLPAVTLRQDTPSRPLLCPACELPWWSVGK